MRSKQVFENGLSLQRNSDVRGVVREADKVIVNVRLLSLL